MTKIKSYSELITIQTFEERLEYLRIFSKIGIDTFGFDRYLNQNLYRSKEWKDIRQKVILRDKGCDLGLDGYEIFEKPIIHHINPITVEDLTNGNFKVFDMNNLITTCHWTHNAIHYGTNNGLETRKPIERSMNDTCPWRK